MNVVMRRSFGDGEADVSGCCTVMTQQVSAALVPDPEFEGASSSSSSSSSSPSKSSSSSSKSMNGISPSTHVAEPVSVGFQLPSLRGINDSLVSISDFIEKGEAGDGAGGESDGSCCSNEGELLDQEEFCDCCGQVLLPVNSLTMFPSPSVRGEGRGRSRSALLSGSGSLSSSLNLASESVATTSAFTSISRTCDICRDRVAREIYFELYPDFPPPLYDQHLGPYLPAYTPAPRRLPGVPGPLLTVIKYFTSMTVDEISAELEALQGAAASAHGSASAHGGELSVGGGTGAGRSGSRLGLAEPKCDSAAVVGGSSVSATTPSRASCYSYDRPSFFGTTAAARNRPSSSYNAEEQFYSPEEQLIQFNRSVSGSLASSPRRSGLSSNFPLQLATPCLPQIPLSMAARMYARAHNLKAFPIPEDAVEDSSAWWDAVATTPTSLLPEETLELIEQLRRQKLLDNSSCPTPSSPSVIGGGGGFVTIGFARKTSDLSPDCANGSSKRLRNRVFRTRLFPGRRERRSLSGDGEGAAGFSSSEQGSRSAMVKAWFKSVVKGTPPNATTRRVAFGEDYTHYEDQAAAESGSKRSPQIATGHGSKRLHSAGEPLKSSLSSRRFGDAAEGAATGCSATRSAASSPGSNNRSEEPDEFWWLKCPSPPAGASSPSTAADNATTPSAIRLSLRDPL